MDAAEYPHSSATCRINRCETVCSSTKRAVGTSLVGIEPASRAPIPGRLLQVPVAIAVTVAALPLLDSGLGKRDEDAFASNLRSGQPRLRGFPDRCYPGRFGLIGAVNACEPTERLHFPQPVNGDRDGRASPRILLGCLVIER